MKRTGMFIITFVLAFSGMFQVFAFDDISGHANENEIRVLMDMNIIERVEEFRPDSFVSRGEYFIWLARLLLNDTELSDMKEAAESLCALNIISNDPSGEYACSEFIKYNEMIKTLVCALSYDCYAEQNGGYPAGYIKAGQYAKIIKERLVSNEKVTKGEAAGFLLKTAQSYPAKITYKNQNEVYYEHGNTETLLQQCKHVDKISGIVTANSDTSILDGQKLSINKVKIENLIVNTGDTNAKEYLGYYVDAYCFKKDNEYTIVSVRPNESYSRNVRLSSFNEISVSGGLKRMEIKYVTDDKEKKFICEDYDVIYNGILFPGFVPEDAEIQDGELVLIDNDGDSHYEVIVIKEYQNYIVSGVNKDQKSISDKYGRVLELSNCDDDSMKIFDRDGNKVDISRIKKNDIISVLKSKDGSYTEITISNEIATGIVIGIEKGEYTKLLIGDNIYYVSKQFEAIEHPDKIKPYLNMDAIFYIDCNGYIADIDYGSETNWNVGYLVATSFERNSIEKELNIRFFSDNGSFEDFLAKDYIFIDGVKRKIDDINIDKELQPQLVQYRLKNNNILVINTDKYNVGEEDDEFNSYAIEGINKYSSGSKLFYSGMDTIVGVKADTVVFIVPESNSYKNDLMYYSKTSIGYFADGSNYNNIIAYGINDCGVASYIVRRFDETTTVGTSSDFVVVESVSRALNAQECVVDKITGMSITGSKFEKTVYFDDIISAQNIMPGDIIRYKQRNGEIFAVSKDVDFNVEYDDLVAFSKDADTNKQGTYSAALNVLCGYIENADEKHIVLGNSSGDKTIIIPLENAKIILSDTTKRGETAVSECNLTDLYSYCRNTNQNVKAAVIIRNGTVVNITVRNESSI